MVPFMRSSLRRLRCVVTLFGLAWPFSGCIRTIEQENSQIGELERDCVVPLPKGTKALGAPVGLEYPDGSRWIWDGVELEDGRFIANVSAFFASADAVCERGPEFETDAAGTPTSLLSLTAAEAVADAARTDGRRLRLVPTGGFVHEATGYLFYDHTLTGPGFFDSELLGTGLCVLADGASACERLRVGNDTILWSADAVPLNRGGLVFDDRAVVYGCRAVADLTSLCSVAGAPLSNLLDPLAYANWNAFDGWGASRERTSVVSDEIGPVSVSPYGKGFLLTTLDIFESRVSLRRADAPTGEFGRRIRAFDIAPPDSGFPGGGHEHHGLRREPNRLHISYSRTAAGVTELRLASFRIFGEFGE